MAWTTMPSMVSRRGPEVVAPPGPTRASDMALAINMRCIARGPPSDAANIAWIIRRADELAPQWEALVPALGYGADGGFYLPARTLSKGAADEANARSRADRVPRLLDWLGHAFPVSRDTWLRRALTRVVEWIDRRKPAAALLERVELAIKKPLFGCQACGNCVLGHLEYVCPQTCPKQLRNGPCGGTDRGRCEVVPDKPCIWIAVYERASASGDLEALKTYVPPPDRQLQGTSSWINYFLDRDARPDRLLVISGADSTRGGHR